MLNCLTRLFTIIYIQCEIHNHLTVIVYVYIYIYSYCSAVNKMGITAMTCINFQSYFLSSQRRNGESSGVLAVILYVQQTFL